MIQVPVQILRQYTTVIAYKNVPQQEQHYYVKWLRFYLDFCHKYNFRQEAHKSLSAFMEKLKEKKQSEKQKKQAHQAVTLYFELILRSTKKVVNNLPQEQNFIENHSTRTKDRTFCQENKGLECFTTHTIRVRL